MTRRGEELRLTGLNIQQKWRIDKERSGIDRVEGYEKVRILKLHTYATVMPFADLRLTSINELYGLCPASVLSTASALQFMSLLLALDRSIDQLRGTRRA